MLGTKHPAPYIDGCYFSGFLAKFDGLNLTDGFERTLPGFFESGGGGQFSRRRNAGFRDYGPQFLEGVCAALLAT